MICSLCFFTYLSAYMTFILKLFGSFKWGVHLKWIFFSVAAIILSSPPNTIQLQNFLSRKEVEEMTHSDILILANSSKINFRYQEWQKKRLKKVCVDDFTHLKEDCFLYDSVTNSSKPVLTRLDWLRISLTMIMFFFLKFLFYYSSSYILIFVKGNL